MTPANIPLSMTDELVATDRETHNGPVNVHVYLRVDGSFLTVRYYNGQESYRTPSRTYPKVQSEGGRMRVARGSTFWKDDVGN